MGPNLYMVLKENPWVNRKSVTVQYTSLLRLNCIVEMGDTGTMPTPVLIYHVK